jgi:exosortase
MATDPAPPGRPKALTVPAGGGERSELKGHVPTGSTGRSAGHRASRPLTSLGTSLFSGSAGPWLVALAGFLAMFAPSYWQAANGLWTTDEFGHAPIILAIAAWLFWQRRDALIESLGPVSPRSLRSLPPEGAGLPWDGPAAGPAPWIGGAMFAAGALLYLAGRALSIASAEFVAHWLVLGAALAWLGGTRALRAAWFPWLYLLFMVPLPATLVDAMTGPLKHAVSVLVVEGLHLVGYPIARSGVMITVGPYQLLVADACSGLNSMFSLAALGTLFIHVVAARRKVAHVALLVASIVPIAFAANVVRVVVLVLVTYHFGDAAGQGFLHGAAGIVLMLVALAIFFGLDLLLAAVFGRRAVAAPSGLVKDSARA